MKPDHVLVQTRISKADAKALNAAAHRDGVSVAALVRRMIVGALETGVGSDQRDFFAAHALTGMISACGHPLACDHRVFASESYCMADAMLEARRQKEGTT